ncbi:MAG: hypothetical protein QM750_29065 [Rubrivivax sp.]
MAPMGDPPMLERQQAGGWTALPLQPMQAQEPRRCSSEDND